MATENQQKFQFVSPITPKYREAFYSSIPVNWQDAVQGCVICLPCARDTFAPQTQVPLVIQGKTVIPQ